MDGFNDRVGKVFDCLSSSSNTKAWSLSDAQIERKTWNRDKTKSDIINDDEILVSSSFDNDPDLDVRSSVGLDPTLDFEDEEDEYDKIAAGTENADSHLLYMKDVTNHAPFLNSHNILSSDIAPSVDNAVKVKSILKRKSSELENPSAKRVRFDSSCKERDAPPVDGVPVPRVAKNVPDYLMNPSKYTRYSFDNDDDKESNTKAYMDFLEQIKKIKDVRAAELPTSVVFIPRKKRGNDAAPYNSEGEVKEMSNGVAAVAVQQDEVGEMIQDEPDVDDVCAKPKPPKFQKPSRRYRSKIEDDDSVC
nr:hypothetical protein [Tanacetum cinerariifolium]